MHLILKFKMQKKLYIEIKGGAFSASSPGCCTLSLMVLPRCTASFWISRGTEFVVCSLESLLPGKSLTFTRWIWFWEIAKLHLKTSFAMMLSDHTREFCFGSKAGKDRRLMRMPSISSLQNLLWDQLLYRQDKYFQTHFFLVIIA